MQHVLTRQQIRDAQGRSYATLVAPELGGALRLASLSYGRWLALQEIYARGEKGEDVTRDLSIFLVSTMIVDAKSEPLYSLDTAAEFIEAVSPETMMRFMAEATKLVKKAAPVESTAASSPPAEPVEVAAKTLGASEAAPQGKVTASPTT